MVRQFLPAILLAVACCAATRADDPPVVKVGQSAPDFTVTGIDGKMFKLSDKLAGGRKNVCLIFSRANW